MVIYFKLFFLLNFTCFKIPKKNAEKHFFRKTNWEVVIIRIFATYYLKATNRFTLSGNNFNAW